MLTSRHIDDLLIPVRLRCVNHITACRNAGIDLLILCTLRDADAQNLLYAQGRSRQQLNAAGLTRVEPRPGRIVTNAIGGDSLHQWKCAYDVVPLRYGKPVWGAAGDGIDSDPSDDDRDDLELWQRVGALGEQCGLQWAGNWIRFREYPHFQFTNGLSIADFKAGKTIPLNA